MVTSSPTHCAPDHFLLSVKSPSLTAAYAPAKKPMKLEPIVMIHGGLISDKTPRSMSQACSTAPPIVPASQKTIQRTRISVDCRASFIAASKGPAAYAFERDHACWGPCAGALIWVWLTREECNTLIEPFCRAADGGGDIETVSLVSRWAAAPGQTTLEVVAVRRSPSPQCRDLFDGPDACGGCALPAHGGHGSQRPCGRAVETLRRRHRARPAPVEGRRLQLHSALEPGLYLRPSAAVFQRVLQRHLQRRRQSHRIDHRSLSFAARFRSRTAPSHRPELRAGADPARHRQSDARGNRAIHRRAGLFDGAPGNSGQN